MTMAISKHKSTLKSHKLTKEVIFVMLQNCEYTCNSLICMNEHWYVWIIIDYWVFWHSHAAWEITSEQFFVGFMGNASEADNLQIKLSEGMFFLDTLQEVKW